MLHISDLDSLSPYYNGCIALYFALGGIGDDDFLNEIGIFKLGLNSYCNMLFNPFEYVNDRIDFTDPDSFVSSEVRDKLSDCDDLDI